MCRLLEFVFGVQIDPAHDSAINALFALLILVLAGEVIYKILHKLALKSRSAIAQITLELAGKYATTWIILAVVIIAVNDLTFIPAKLQSIIKTVAKIMLITTFASAGIKGFTMWFQTVSADSVSLKTIENPVKFMFKIAVIITVSMLMMDSLGISITPIITTLGLGSLAVALALQDTLANFFSGLHIAADRPVRIGDFVRVDETEGYIEQIGWRSTKIKTRSNFMIIYPNSRIAQSIITNYSLPIPLTRLQLPVSVSYGSDTRKVSEVIVDELLKATSDFEDIVTDPAPFARFDGFGDSALNMQACCYVKDFSRAGRLRTELNHRIFARFRKEGIEIPFPIRTVYLKGQQNVAS